MNNRIFEIDVLRGIAIVLVVLYHFIFDINYFHLAQIELYSGFWLYFQRFAATLFILIFGASLAISAQKPNHVNRFVKRAAKLGIIALLITIVTWFYPHEGFIFFGVIHFFAVATLLSLLFISLREWNLPLGVLIILLGLEFNAIHTTNPLLIPFGVLTYETITLDYFPLLPWFGVALIGTYIGLELYIKRKVQLNLTKNHVTNALSYLGKNTLTIYLLHQMLLIPILIIARPFF